MYLSLPAHIDKIAECICRDMEQGFADSVEARLVFMQQRGVTDPYELAQIRQDYISEHQPKAQALLDKYLDVIPDYLAAHDCSDDEFAQSWALMGGIWNNVEFERIRHIVRVQYRYPALLDVARVMGRIADDEGPERVPLGMGNKNKVDHSAPSDIEGVGVGNDLSSLLPLELAQMSDSELSSLFAYKFATRRLQTFSYKSNIMHPQHKLQLHRARQKGPMVVCLDTSASMLGVPSEVSHSLVVKLLSLALAQDRELLLIPFSVNARPFDVRRNRTRLLDFFRQQASGDTDATKMIELLVTTLCSREEYGGADVLLISDFQIPMPSSSLLRQLNMLRDAGTKFFGLQIGETQESAWPSYFDRIWFLPYETRMRPWYIQK
ncbi:MAG: hypothetical protein KBT20_08900 [Bacteroidales bacterium]|nr:hypothetical protein [Candidatus Liminaster caballi]